MALWWLYGGYIFPVVVKPDNLTFKVKFDLEGQGQLFPKTIRILTKVFCTSGPNLMVLASTGDELSHRQAQNAVNFDFEVKFDHEGHGQSPPKIIGTLNKIFYTYGPNLVIIVWMVIVRTNLVTDGRTDGRTDRRWQRQYPAAKTGLG